jgi:hypothetical protein
VGDILQAKRRGAAPLGQNGFRRIQDMGPGIFRRAPDALLLLVFLGFPGGFSGRWFFCRQRRPSLLTIL